MTRNPVFECEESNVSLSVRCNTNTSRCNINRFLYLWDKNVDDEIRIDQEIETLIPGYIAISDDATCVISEKIEGVDRNGLPIRTIVLVFHCKNNEICKYSRSRNILLYGDWASVDSVSQQ